MRASFSYFHSTLSDRAKAADQSSGIHVPPREPQLDGFADCTDVVPDGWSYFAEQGNKAKGLVLLGVAHVESADATAYRARAAPRGVCAEQSERAVHTAQSLMRRVR